MNICPTTGLVLPKEFVDEKQALVNLINDFVDRVTREHSYIEGTYYITFHAKFNPQNPTEFMVDQPKITKKIPPFVSNTIVWWVCNKRGVSELLWIVAPKLPGSKLKVEFNKSGVAYLQAKGAMPS